MAPVDAAIWATCGAHIAGMALGIGVLHGRLVAGPFGWWMGRACSGVATDYARRDILTTIVVMATTVKVSMVISELEVELNRAAATWEALPACCVRLAMVVSARTPVSDMPPIYSPRRSAYGAP